MDDPVPTHTPQYGWLVNETTTTTTSNPQNRWIIFSRWRDNRRPIDRAEAAARYVVQCCTALAASTTKNGTCTVWYTVATVSTRRPTWRKCLPNIYIYFFSHEEI
jgi:hypothetical protein